jgi:hypothetical protein
LPYFLVETGGAKVNDWWFGVEASKISAIARLTPNAQYPLMKKTAVLQKALRLCEAEHFKTDSRAALLRAASCRSPSRHPGSAIQ